MKTCKNTMFVLFVMLSLLAGCGGKGEEKKEIVFEKAEASPQRITEGEKSRVAWKVSGNAATLQLYKELGNVPVLERSDLPLPEGSIEITPQKNTTFRLQATGPDGKKDAWVSVEVTPRQQPAPPPDPNPNPGPDPIPTPDPGPVPPPPPPQDTCVENPGMKFGVAGKANNMGPIVAPNENTVVFFYTTTEPDGSYRWFKQAKSIDGGITFNEKVIAEHIGEIGSGGGVSSFLVHDQISSSLNLIYFFGPPVFKRSYDNGDTWTSDSLIPISPDFGGSDQLVVIGDTIYYFYTSGTRSGRIYLQVGNYNPSTRNTVWQSAWPVYDSSRIVSLEGAFPDSSAKLYLVFGERDTSTNPQAQFTSLITSLDGVNWSMPTRVQIFNESSPEVGATIVNTSGTIYQWYRDGSTWKIRSSSDFSNWTLVGTPPIGGKTLVGPYGFIVAQSASCGNNLVGLKVTRSSDGLVWSPPSWFQVLSIPNTDLGPDGGFVFPSFSLAATPSGKLRTLRTRIMKNVDVNNPSELYLMQDP